MWRDSPCQMCATLRSRQARPDPSQPAVLWGSLDRSPSDHESSSTAHGHTAWRVGMRKIRMQAALDRSVLVDGSRAHCVACRDAQDTDTGRSRSISPCPLLTGTLRQQRAYPSQPAVMLWGTPRRLMCGPKKSDSCFVLSGTDGGFVPQVLWMVDDFRTGVCVCVCVCVCVVNDFRTGVTAPPAPPPRTQPFMRYATRTRGPHMRLGRPSRTCDSDGRPERSEPHSRAEPDGWRASTRMAPRRLG